MTQILSITFCTILSFVFFSHSAHAQYVKLQDTAFANFICEYYSTNAVMDTQCESIDTARVQKELFGYMNFGGRTTVQSVADLHYFSSISTINGHSNSIDSIYGLSSDALKIIDFHNNPLEYIQDLSALHSLTQVYLYNTNLKDIHGYSSCLLLEKLNIKQNHIGELEDFTDLPNLEKVYLSENRLTFEDFHPIVSYPGYDTIFSFFPQAPTTENDTVAIDKHGNLTLSYSIDDTVSGLTFQWYKDNAILPGETNRQLVYTDVQPEQSGNYHVQIKSSILGKSLGFLQSGTWLVNIAGVAEPCIGKYTFSFDKEETCRGASAILNSFTCENTSSLSYVLSNIHTNNSIDIEKGLPYSLDTGMYRLTVNDTAQCSFLIDSALKISQPDSCIQEKACFGTVNFEFETTQSCNEYSAKLIYFKTEYEKTCQLFLQNSETRTAIELGTSVSLQPGSYRFVVENQADCIYELPNAVTLVKKDNCRQVFSPNGDGINDSWFIDGKGILKICNIDGTVLCELQLPVSWNGTDVSGSELPVGLYILVFPNGEMQQLTLLR